MLTAYVNLSPAAKIKKMHMSGRFLLCICFFFLIVRSVVDATNETDTLKKHENDIAQHSFSSVTGTRNQEKPKRLFARTRYLSPQRPHVQRPKPETLGEAHIPVRRCARLNESCSVHTPCCEPCASCHCRLFNTICHCWRLGACHKKT